MKTKITAIILALCLCAALLSGCGGSSSTAVSTTTDFPAATTIPSNTSDVENTASIKNEVLGIVTENAAYLSEDDVLSLCKECGLSFDAFSRYEICPDETYTTQDAAEYLIAEGCSTIIFNEKGSSEIAEIISDQYPQIKFVVTDSAKEVTPIIEQQYPIYEALTVFSEERAWVKYQDLNNNYDLGVIDTQGWLVWSINTADLAEKWGTYPSQITATPFCDGISCIHPDNSNKYSDSIAGMIIINDVGKILFDSRKSPEGTLYYYLGYGDGTVLAIRHTADFSASKKYIIEMNCNGEIEYEKELDNDFSITGHRGPVALAGHVSDDYSYYGEDIFLGTQHGEGPMVYNRETHSFFLANYRNWAFLTLCDSFKDGTSIGFISGDYLYRISASDLQDENHWLSFLDKNNITKGSAYLRDANGSLIDLNTSIEYVAEDRIIQKDGVYDYSGNLIATYPADWKIEEVTAFNGGYAPLVLKGADGNTYITIVNKNGAPQYDPVKIDSYTFPAWHGYVSVAISGNDTILDPQGNRTDTSELNRMSQNYTIGWKKSSSSNGTYVRLYGTVRCGFSREYDSDVERYTSYSSIDGKSINTVYVITNYNEVASQQITIQTQQNEEIVSSAAPKEYVTLGNFSIEGKWKNVGTYTFGQVDNGGIVSFDGTYCNLYSPRDTYAFYKDGDSYRLDTTSLLGEPTSFTVKIVDKDNIDVYYGSDYLELTRVS